MASKPMFIYRVEKRDGFDSNDDAVTRMGGGFLAMADDIDSWGNNFFIWGAGPVDEKSLLLIEEKWHELITKGKTQLGHYFYTIIRKI